MLFLAHYLNNISRNQVQVLTPSNGRVQSDNKSSCNPLDLTDLLLRLENEIHTVDEKVTITNMEGEILFSNFSVET